MRRILLSLAVILAAGGAWAGVQGSKHDFTSTGGAPILGVDNLCESCHMPHRPVRNVPLWSHSLTGSTFNMYNTNANYNGINTAAYDSSPNALTGTRSQLCLSCHDGTVAVASSTFLSMTSPSWMLFNNGVPVSGGAGSNGLMGSHPISVNYNLVKTNQPTNFKDIASDPDVKLENGKVQCASCHNPHNIFPKMLVKSNSGNSPLCLTCHIK